MENKTVEQLLAMTDEEVAALSPQQKANRTKQINAAKPATPKSGDLANSVIGTAAGQAAIPPVAGATAPPSTPTPPAGPTQAEIDAELAKSNQLLKEQHEKEQQDKDAAEQKKLLQQQERDNKLKAVQEEEQRLANETKERELKERLEKEQQEADELAAKAEQQLIYKYGAGYIRAKKGTLSTIFSARAWGFLGNNKDGWVPDVEEPAEVKNFKKGDN